MDEIKIEKALGKIEEEKEGIREKEEIKTEYEEIQTEEQISDGEKESDKKNILIFIGVIIVIFVLIFVGSKFYNNFTSSATVINVDELHRENLEGNLDEEEGYVYNGFSFVKVDGLWWTEIRRPDILIKTPLHFGPKEVEAITIQGSLSKDFNKGEEVFVAIDPNVRDKYYSLAISELSFNMVKGMGRLPIGSCTEEHWACENRTIVNCQNTAGSPVVELVLANETKIELKGTCIKISGQEYGIVKAVNRLLYQWYGVMR